MYTTPVERSFARMGARLTMGAELKPRPRGGGSQVAIDVQRDRLGERFEIALLPGARPEISVLDVQPAERHLLLLVREGSQKHKFLCGHDERHWFVAAIPEAAPAGTVDQAKEALKPQWVQLEQNRRKLPSRIRHRRKNPVYVRQGEWFFIPMPNFPANEKLVLRNEPLSRGAGSKPHWAEFCHREGGETVMVCRLYPRGISLAQYRKLLERRPAARSRNWQTLRRNPRVYVRGRIRHVDHKTITLAEWHQVLMNTENQSDAMRSVAFLD